MFFVISALKIDSLGSLILIPPLVDAICKKYDKYDVDKNKDSNDSGDDAFARLYGVVEADIEATLQVSARVCIRGGVG